MSGVTASANGLSFICRYVSSPGSSRNLTRAEIYDFEANGIGIVIVFEQTADSALGGWRQGIADAQSASTQVAALGIADCPIYFAVDFDASENQLPVVGAYLQGAASVIGIDRTGVYGGYAVVQYAFNNGLVTYGWQTYAWSGTNLDGRCHLYQYQNSVTIGDVFCDRDRTESSDTNYGQVGAAVDGISPNAGDVAGGTVVTVHGRGFTGAKGINFGENAAVTYRIDHDKQITATSPTAGATGMVDVTVVTAAGSSATGAADQFSYCTTPVVTSFSPTSGGSAGGTIVVLTGRGFLGATAVNFGANASVTYYVDSDTQITALSPAGTGSVNLIVTTPAGSSSSSLSTQFIYAIEGGRRLRSRSRIIE